jgi:hypothetical protein
VSGYSRRRATMHVVLLYTLGALRSLRPPTASIGIDANTVHNTLPKMAPRPLYSPVGGMPKESLRRPVSLLHVNFAFDLSFHEHIFFASSSTKLKTKAVMQSANAIQNDEAALANCECRGCHGRTKMELPHIMRLGLS